MNKLQIPAETERATVGEYLMADNPCKLCTKRTCNYACPHRESAVYLVACFPHLGMVYCGITEQSVYRRIRQHLGKPGDPFGDWVRNVTADSLDFRLDILHNPTKNREWLVQTEKALIDYHGSFLNVQHNR